MGIEEKTRLRGATTAEEGDGDELEVTREEMEAVRGLLRVIVADLVKIQPDMVEASSAIVAHGRTAADINLMYRRTNYPNSFDSQKPTSPAS